jgi:hypothetical protein
MGVIGQMVLPVKFATTIPASRSLTAVCIYEAADQGMATIFAMCGTEGEMAGSGRRGGRPRRDGRGRPVVSSGLAARWVAAGRPGLMAGRLRLVPAGGLPVAGDLDR